MFGLDAIWQSVVDFFTISPFWWFLFWGVIGVAILTLAAWYFNFLRPLAGIVAVAVGFFLYGYRRAEGDVAKRERERRERERQRPVNQPQWKWPWEP